MDLHIKCLFQPLTVHQEKENGLDHLEIEDRRRIWTCWQKLKKKEY